MGSRLLDSTVYGCESSSTRNDLCILRRLRVFHPRRIRLGFCKPDPPLRIPRSRKLDIVQQGWDRLAFLQLLKKGTVKGLRTLGFSVKEIYE